MALKIEDIAVSVDAPIEEDDQKRMDNSLYYSETFGIPPNTAFDLEPELNIEVFGKEMLPAAPGTMFKDAFIQSLATKPAMMLRGAEVYTKGEGLGLDPLMDRASIYLESLKDPKLEQKLQQVAAGKLWPIGDEKRWWQVESKYIPEVINAWAVNIGDQIPIMLATIAGRMAGKAIGKPLGAAIGGGAAMVTGGPDPSDVATAPAITAITTQITKHLGGAAPMIAMEAGNFMDEANALEIDKDIAEKYARIYGLGSGAIEYAQWLWVLGRYKAISGPVKKSIMKVVLAHLGGSAVEGLEEISQEGLQNKLLQITVDEMKERYPQYDKEAPKTWHGWQRAGAIGSGVAAITGLPGTGMTMAQGRLARQTEVKPETKKFLGEPSTQELEQAEARPEAPVEVPETPVSGQERAEAKQAKEIETPAERKVAEAQLEVEAAEEVQPNLYIGSITEGMKRRIEKGTSLSAKDMQGFKEKGFPTIRTKIKMARGEAEQYLEFLEKDLIRRLENNLIRTENDLAKANADWGDIKTLREVLALEAVKRPFSVTRAEKHKIKVIEKAKSRIFEAIRPTEESKMTVGEVLTTVMRRSARAAKIGSAAGRRQLRAEIRAKKRAKVRLNKALKTLKQKISSRVDFFYREAIQALTSGMDLAFRSEKTMAQRKATADFIKRVPEKATDIPVKLMKQLSQKPLNDFTIEELEEVAAEVEKLIEQGKLKRRLKLKPELKERKATIEQLTANTEAVKKSRVKAGPKVLSTTKRGIINTTFDKIKAWTWIPQNLFDMLDGRKKWKGLWHEVFYNQVKRAKAKFLEHKQARQVAFQNKQQALKLTDWQLSGMREVNGIRYQVQELMGIYMASKNRLSKLVLRYGHELSDSHIQSAINALTAEEKQLADFILEDYEKNYPRLRRAVIEQENRDMGVEEEYSPIRRVGDFARTLESEIIDSMLRREQIRRHNVAHGFTLARKEVPKELQTPMRLDAINVYLDQIAKQERYIEIGPQVRKMHKILANKNLRKTVIGRFGSDVNKMLDGYVASVANPYIYKQFTDIDRASAYLRRNTAIAYLGFNLVTMGKQLPSVLLYVADAGPSHMLASAVEFAINPLETIKKVRSLDPELADRSLERELQEIKNLPNASFIQKKIGKYGMEGIYLFDTIARTIGWNAVYEQALSEDKSQAEAIQTARNATLRTQPAAAAEDIPTLYRTNEVLNWFTMFTNQLNKIFNIATYDIPSYIQNEEYSKAALQSLGMGIVALTIWVVTNRKLPEEPKEFAEAIGEQAINMIPLLGKPIMGERKGWGNDLPVFAPVKILSVPIVAFEDWELTRSDTRAIAEGIAVATGIPYTAIRRGVQAWEEEQPTALLGGRRPKKTRGTRRRTSVRR
jgi:hypothetical protein